MPVPPGLDLRTIGDFMVAVDVRQTDWGEVTHLEIARRDDRPVHSWYDLWNIKNEICGEDRVAVEIYPESSRLVDAQHAYHLWVLPPGFRLPFGIHELDNAPHEHCLHHTGETLTVSPPLHQKLCCFCGEKVNERSPAHEPRPGPHGVFVLHVPLRYRRAGP